jgi:hypothetical protein
MGREIKSRRGMYRVVAFKNVTFTVKKVAKTFGQLVYIAFKKWPK